LSDTNEEFEFLEQFVEDSKPLYPNVAGYDILIQTPFRYKLPVPDRYAARFRPGFFHKNVFYASHEKKTALYESSFHFLKQRHHLSGLSQTPEPRTLFSLGVDTRAAIDIRGYPNVNKIMDRNDYSASHNFVNQNTNLEVLLYPSCRCPNKGLNAAVYEITKLEKKPRSKESLHFIYDSSMQGVRISSGVDLVLFILWKDVS
jgi:hypothetical protein